LAVLPSAAGSSTDPAVLAAESKYNEARRQTVVMTHVRGFLPAQGMSVIPSYITSFIFLPVSIINYQQLFISKL